MPRPCTYDSTCPNPATVGSRCEVHAAKYTQTKDQRIKDRDSVRIAVYKSREWKGVRRAVLEANPFCVDCKMAVANTVDHVLPLRQVLEQHGDPYDMENLEAVCASCHSKRTRLEQQGLK